MRNDRTLGKRQKEAGIALLISIFVLLLISVVAIAMIISSGTESSLEGNYRASTGAYNAAVAGIEEVRARLRSSDPNSFKNTAPGFLPPAGTALTVCLPVYLINPNGAEAVAPWDPNNAYYDTEFSREFPNDCGGAPPPNPSPSTASVWNRNPLNGLPFAGPLYKWVRINGVTEKSLNLDTFPHDTTIDLKLVYYDGTNLTDVSTGGQTQVLEITALAVLPGKNQNESTQKLLQYLVAPLVSAVTVPPLPAALTLAGSTAPNANVVGYSAPSSTGGFGMKGLDQDCSGAATGAKFAAIGVVNNADINAVKSGGVVNGISYTGIPAAYQPNYPGLSTAPDIENVSSNFSATQLTPSGLDAMVQSIIQSADGTIPAGSNSTQTSYLTSLVSSGAMSSSSPITLVANGDLDLTSWHNTGYGLLLVTGNLTYDPDTSWNGIILVIGQGTVIGSRGGSGVINGAMLVARTRDTSGNLLPGPNLGYSYVNFNNGSSMGGVGINYSNCWVQKSQPVARSNYKVLSFHEIGQ